MKPATWPRQDVSAERLLSVDARGDAVRDLRVSDLPSLLRAGDVLVVNDAATLPAALRGMTADGAPLEARLWQHEDDSTFSALLLGPGEPRTRTEDLPPPPRVAPGDLLRFAELRATVRAVDPRSPRLVRLAFEREGAALFAALHRVGRPIQYAYVEGTYAPWHVQTRFAARPVAAEMPSAGRPLTWDALLAMRRAGVVIVPLTHAAGLSSTGDAALDALLPWPEHWWVPEATAAAVNAARREGRRVIAVGTTVVRALESAAGDDGVVQPGQGVTSLVLSEARPARVVTGLLTGVHAPGESHFSLLCAVAPRPLLERALAHAEAEGYLAHEMGDSMFVAA